MSYADPFSVYLQLAEKVFKREVKLNALSACLPALPPLDRGLLDRLAEESEKASLSQPRMSWAICCVAEKASRLQKLDLFTRSLAAWYLGRAANRWVQPQKIAKAIARARRGFEKLGDTGWVAACDWMANDLPWLSNDLIKAEEKLINSSIELLKSNFTIFTLYCLLALAQTQILLNKLELAENITNKCESLLINEDLCLARCYIVRADILRRKKKFAEAVKFVEKSKTIFQQYSSFQDLAKLSYLTGIIYLFSVTDFDKISKNFFDALKIFSESEIYLWKGISLTYLGVTSMQSGKHFFALSFYSDAEKIFKQLHINSLLAQNYTGQGKLNIYLGNFENGITKLIKAKNIHIKAGRLLNAGIDITNIGEAYFQLSRYQDAINSYESASEIFSTQNDIVKLGLLQINLANYWIRLKKYEFAEKQLNLAEHNLTISNQVDSQISIINSRARIRFELGDIEGSQHFLLDSLELAKTGNFEPQIALTELNLGEIYIANNKWTDAIILFNLAMKKYETLGMQYHQVLCKIAMGSYYTKVNQKKQAQSFFIKALQISSGIYTEMDWRAYAGLAELHKPRKAVTYYHQAVNSLNTIRESFWQPDLAGSYSQTPGQMVAKAVRLAAAHSPPEEVLLFIEADKAVSLRQQFNLTRQPAHDPLSEEIAEDKAEIHWIRQQIQSISMSNTTLHADPRLPELQTRLRAKKVHCDELVSLLDRRQTGVVTDFQRQVFSLEACRQMLNIRIGSNWTAINFYQLEDQIVSVFITPDASQTLTIPLTPRLKKALRVCQQSHQNSALPSASDLRILGECLIPSEVLNYLTSETTMLIIPHQSLHGIPWAAIGEVPLVTQCLPVVAPSLKSLALIWEHNFRTDTPHERKALLAGASLFEGRHPNLPAVEEELAVLHAIGNNNMTRTEENTTTFAEFKQSLGEAEQPPFDGLHLSTHFFSDPESGRLSGIALQNEDIFVDQLRDLAPLPALVTFSGCNSLFGQVYAGDEQISLPNTCFLAGATNVIGSVWPVLDRSTIPIMTRFYTHYLVGASPAQALAMAQRESVQAGDEGRSWAGFCCLGIP